MKRFIFAIICVMFVFLIIALHKIYAQEKIEAKPVKSAIAVASTSIFGKLYLAGSAKLIGGKADVIFEKNVFTSSPDIKVIVTPVGSWSGIYVTNVTTNGFTVKAETGDTEAKFNWIAVSK